MKYLLALLFIPFVACAPASSGTASSQATNDVVSARAFTLVALGSGNRATGRVETALQPNGSTRLTIAISGLTAGSAHAAHIHSGSCSQPGAIVVVLAEVKADSSGSAAQNNAVDTARIPQSAYVMVHVRDSNAANGPGPGMACANIR
jgi:CHRD domain